MAVHQNGVRASSTQLCVIAVGRECSLLVDLNTVSVKKPDTPLVIKSDVERGYRNDVNPGAIIAPSALSVVPDPPAPLGANGRGGDTIAWKAIVRGVGLPSALREYPSSRGIGASPPTACQRKSEKEE